MYVYQCENSMESIFTAIYQIYEDRHNLGDTVIQLDEEPLLFAEYITVVTDLEKAQKVARTLRSRFGEEDYDTICLALTSPHAEKAQAVYRTVAYGLSSRPAKGHLFDHLTDDNVRKTAFLGQSASKECCHLKGFLRFAELDNGLLFARIEPKNNLVAHLMEHFSDRFPSENFAVYDEGRGLMGIHPAGREWFLASGEELESALDGVRVSRKEEEYAELFRHFCRRITIAERSNPKLQQNMLPLRFREYMTEFQL